MKKLSILLILVMLLTTIGVFTTDSMASNRIIYTVKKGDTLWSISQQVGTSVELIRKQNQNIDPNNLYIGQKLVITISSGETGSNYVNYTVRSGDTLWKIARQYRTTVEKIIQDNRLNYPYYVYVGQVLRIARSNYPAPGKYFYYTVKAGDILWNIAQKYGTTVEQLVKLNKIRNAYDLYIGRRLLVPKTVVPVNPEPGQDHNSNYVPYAFYQVQKGDKTWTIADTFGIRTSILVRYNQIKDINNLKVGDVLIIPLQQSTKLSYIKKASAGLNKYYRVRSNETLAAIAEYYQVPVEGIRAINRMTKQEEVYTGQRLLMPVSPALFKKHQLYRVKSGGEYIFDIAYNKGISIRSILRANYLKDSNQKFSAGTVIIVPQDKDSQVTWIDYENGKPVNSWFS